MDNGINQVIDSFIKGPAVIGKVDAPRDKCGHSGAINHGHTCCYM